jgi:2-methylisocitrate lyase-like PEP mutase family enzyme
MTQPGQMHTDQQTKASLFYQLHHNGSMLVLPNIWDPLGALLLQSIGYPAVATASAAIAYSDGYDDGEQIPFDEVLKRLSRIAGRVNVPVTADIESGYADTKDGLRENIKKLIDTGIVGVNIEDGDKQTGLLLPVDIQSERIHLVRAVADEAGIRLFINARTDVYIKGKDYDDDGKLSETIKRGKTYIDAGADCIFPIAVKQIDHIRELTSNLEIPVNILAIPGVPGLKVLNESGVARVSLGPGFQKIAVRAMKNIAENLMIFEGMDEIAANEITSDYLKNLVNKTK